MSKYYVFCDDWLIAVYKDARTAKNLCRRLHALNYYDGNRIGIYRKGEDGILDEKPWLTADKLP